MPSVAAALVFMALARQGQAQDTLSLNQTIKEVLSNNNRAVAARFMQQSAEARVGVESAWSDPMLMVGVANLPTSFDFKKDEMTMRMVGLSQQIPYAGEKGLQTQAAKATASAARAQTETTELELITAAKTAFYNAFYRQQNLRELETQREFLKQVAASAEARLRSNQANQEDVAAAQADLWRLEAQILSAEQQLDAARYNLTALMGRDPEQAPATVESPADVAVPESAESWRQAARNNYPPLQRLDWESQSYAFDASAANRMRWPMLELAANYGYRADGDMGPRDDMVAFQANISLPIFAGRKQSDMARSMDAMRQSSDAEARQLWRDVQADLETLHSRARKLNEAHRMYRERIIPAAEDAFRSAFAGYSANRTPFINLLLYVTAIYRDRVTANDLANDLAVTIAQAERYTLDPKSWAENR